MAEFVRARGAILVDSPHIAKWQRRALEGAHDVLDIQAVIVCENSRNNKNVFKNFLYYILNLFSIRNSETVAVPWRDLVKHDCEVVTFSCTEIDGWQVIGTSVSPTVKALGLDIIVRLGMNLIRDPESLPARHGVLSFHHGDPRAFRGRPAGFYEILNHADSIGSMVQQLSTKLDSGTVRAFGQYRLTKHSYRRTLEYVYSQSASLLRLAVLNCLEGTTVDMDAHGKVFRLPTNTVVLRFLTIILWRKLRRLVFGLLFTRSWEISWSNTTDIAGDHQLVELSTRDRVAKPAGVSFIADPFILRDGVIICEAMPRHGTQGKLMIHDGQTWSELDTTFLDDTRHLSFPFVLHHEEKTYVLPEMAQYGQQELWEIGEGLRVTDVQQLRGLEDQRLIDPVLFRSDDQWWLFAGVSGSEADHLFLWSSHSLEGVFVPHRKNPVVINPASARNAGGLITLNGQLFRLGQNNCDEYGDGIAVHRVLELSHESYREKTIQTIKATGSRGPHTLSTNGHLSIVDHYSITFDPLSWYARAKAVFGG